MTKLYDLRAIYEQESDSCDDPERLGQDIEISTHDAGGGIYYTIKTERWAFENVKELEMIIKDFQKRFNMPSKITELKETQ